MSNSIINETLSSSSNNSVDYYQITTSASASIYDIFNEQIFDELHIEKKDFCNYVKDCDNEKTVLCLVCKYFKNLDVPKLAERKRLAEVIRENL